jgi:hypothetical protein
MKQLLVCVAIVFTSCALVSAQDAQTQVYVGQVYGTVNGLPVGYNGQTGVVQVGNGSGGGIIYNANTGGFQIGGTIGGTAVSIGTGGVFVGDGFGGANTGLLGLLALAQLIVARLVPFLVGIAVLAFFWFLVQFIWKGNESGDVQQKSLSGMAYSVLALFIMVSVWGIISFAGSILGINQGGTAPKTCLPGEVTC